MYPEEQGKEAGTETHDPSPQMMKHWFRRAPPPDVSQPLAAPGQWPIALYLEGESDLGTPMYVQVCPSRTADAPPVTEVYLTASGFFHPILVLGEELSRVTQTLISLAGRALDEPARTVVYVQGTATVEPQRQILALMRLLGRTPVVWALNGQTGADWLAASDTAMHRRLRELLRESPVMDDDGDTVDLILHSMLSLSRDPLHHVDDLVARCRTLYAYAAQMQSDAAQTASKVISLTALTPPQATGDAANDMAAADTWDAHATRRRMLEWAVKTDLALIAEVRDLCAVRLSDLSPMLTDTGWGLETADTVVVALPGRATVEQRAQRRFVLDAILHDLLLRVDPQRPITLLLDGVEELCVHGLPTEIGTGSHTSQTLIERLLALPPLAERGLQVILSAPASADLDPALRERLLAAAPLAIIHATQTAEPILDALSGQAMRTIPMIQPVSRGTGVTLTRRVEPAQSVPACRARGLAPAEAYLVTGQHAALIQMIPFDIPAAQTAPSRADTTARTRKEGD